MRLKKSGMRLSSRRSILAIALIAVAFVAIGYCYWSVQTWDSYDNTYTTFKQKDREDIDNALALAADSYDERKRKIASLNEVIDNIKANKSVCNVPYLIKWQGQLFAGSKSKISKCNESVELMDDYGVNLKSVISYLETEQKIAGILNSTASNQKQTEKTWDHQLAAWTKAVGDIGGVQAEASSQSMKENALKYAEKMEKSWKAVIAAHKARNKAKYLEAYAELVKSHETLASITSDSQAAFNVLAKKLQSSYDSLK
jgi:hypothetical protein